LPGACFGSFYFQEVNHLKVSDYIADFLARRKCTHVFGYPGGAVTYLMDSFYAADGISFIGTYHEQGSAFAAEGFARMTNDIGVAVATSGPGATNLLTGVGSAYFDSIPCLYITGQVNTYEYKGDSPVRQVGFQETDIVSIVKPITKYAVRVTDPNRIRYELEKAVSIANSGRKGPVLLDIPLDIQRTEIDEDALEGYRKPKLPTRDFDPDPVADLLLHSSRPVILAGGGIRLSSARTALKNFAEPLQIPVVSSLMGRDAYDNTCENYCGMLGSYGNRYANLAVAGSDLILALGTRLDTRQTGTDPASFAQGAKLVRVDIDPDELTKKIKAEEYGIEMDAGDFLLRLNQSEKIRGISPLTYQLWLKRIKTLQRRYPSYSEASSEDPNFILSELSGLLGDDDVVCLDVGQNQMWAAQSLTVRKNQRLLACGGMGAMGFALPAAIGAYYSHASAGRVIAIVGDGGLQMNIQELALLERNHIPIKIIVMNNRSLGMIRHFQELYFGGRYNGTVKDYKAPDFCRIADAYGIPSVRISGIGALPAVKGLLSSDGPVLIEIPLPQNTHVYPKLSVGRPIEDQEPLLPRSELAEDMLIMNDGIV
jgi:Thiamine pyrophosphate-requiring enzymes [acetolactate synthase, pyruvate dehydrogenase (cytochrome), glyoxylate carboligase, phosphonopyruvate decarboxylase]